MPGSADTQIVQVDPATGDSTTGSSNGSTLQNVDQFLVDIGNLVGTKYMQVQQQNAQITQQAQTAQAESGLITYGGYAIIAVVAIFILIALVSLFKKAV